MHFILAKICNIPQLKNSKYFFRAEPTLDAFNPVEVILWSSCFSLSKSHFPYLKNHDGDDHGNNCLNNTNVLELLNRIK